MIMDEFIKTAGKRIEKNDDFNETDYLITAVSYEDNRISKVELWQNVNKNTYAFVDYENRERVFERLKNKEKIYTAIKSVIGKYKIKAGVIPYNNEYIKTKNNNEKCDNLGEIRKFNLNNKKYRIGDTIDISDRKTSK
jgi:predicted DNA-binding protein YlxM (UPF0122 family)